MTIIRRLIGHMLAALLRILEKLHPGDNLQRGATLREMTADFDRTGLCVTEAVRLPIAWKDKEVIYPKYERSIAHSFWRAQEFSLFMQHQFMLERPIADLGCGDGSFSAALFDSIEYGIDIDPHALEIARQFGIYNELVLSDKGNIPLPDASVSTVFSNSVLEHVAGIDAVLAEVARILRPGGRFIFSVPILQLAHDLTYWFGKAESRSLNEAYYHRNLMDVMEWQELLGRHGFELTFARQYQPAGFTYSYWMYRLCGDRALGRVLPNLREWMWKKNAKQWVDAVRRSIDGSTQLGGNCFFVAVRRSGAS